MNPAASPDSFHYVTLVTHLAGGGGAAVAAIWLVGGRERYDRAGLAVVVALALSAFAALMFVLSAGNHILTGQLESLRNLVWLLVLYRLFASDGRHATPSPVRPVIFAASFVELLYLAASMVLFRNIGPSDEGVLLAHLLILLRLLVTVGGLVLVHNLYLGATATSRLILRWPAAALAVIWGFDLNLNAIAYLTDSWPEELIALRGLPTALAAALLAIGATRNREELRLRPSRAVTFRSVSLLLIGGYLFGMVAIAQWLTVSGGDLSRLTAMVFVVTASAAALLVVPSRRLRSWIRVTVAKHFFQHRYDYRAEWLRFTRTIGQAGGSAAPIEQRVVQAVADIAESPAGLLLSPDENGDMVLSVRWQWPTAAVPPQALAPAAGRFLEQSGFIIDIDAVRAGREAQGEAVATPQWLIDDARAWAMVPLLHFDRLVGVVVLARPAHARNFDWEVLDLLRVVGRQLASYLAEHAGQTALAEASRFDDFNRRIAFVMHDIKNLASQLSLLARNAEKHADNPAFRDDMLITLRNSADKLNALLARLSRYGSGAADQVGEVRADEVLAAVARQFAPGGAVSLVPCEPIRVRANGEALEQVLVHLVQNAIDASQPDQKVLLSLVKEGAGARIEVKDSGHGMSLDFVRTKLFKPFVSSKPGGFGIGAYEARELVRAMGGRLEVESHEGLGSRFTVLLPLAEASQLLETANHSTRKVA
jgi:putative PEP-CTERM system histidine kinase